MFNAIEFDTAGAYSVSDNGYRVKTAGKYMISVVVNLAGSTSAQGYLAICKNDIVYKYGTSITASQFGFVDNFTFIVNCVVNDLIQIKVYLSETDNTNSSSVGTIMSGAFVGA